MLAIVARDVEHAGCPVDVDFAVAADAGRVGIGVVTTATREGARGTPVASWPELALDDDGAVRLVLVGGRVRSLDVNLSSGDGLRQGGEGTELEDPGLHCDGFCVCVRVCRINRLIITRSG